MRFWTTAFRLVRFRILFLFLAGLASCGLFDHDKETVNTSIEGEAVRIANHTSSTIYYMIGEVDFLESYEWYPDFNRPAIKSGSSVLVPFANIQNGKNTPVQHGDQAVLYWWNGSYRDAEDLHATQITL
jgi:hypothetical protein